jgi:two-component system sensor histidine kinase BaeS
MKSKLFIKFLLLLVVTSLSVVIMMVVTMQFFVYRNFSDYVVQQELDSLDGLAQALSMEYQKVNNWEIFKNEPRRWHDILNSYFPASESRLPLPPENDFYERSVNYQDQINPGNERTPQSGHPPVRDYSKDRADRDARNPIGAMDRRQRPMPPHRAPEISEMALRLSLLDMQKQIVIGNPVLSEQVFTPILMNKQVIGWVGLKKDPDTMSPTDISFLKRQSRAFYMIGAIVLMMAFVVSVIFSRHLTSPVKKIAQGAKAIRNRRFDKRITVTSNDELGQLAEDFNAMAQTLQNYESTRRQWLSDIAHELRTPLAVLRGEIEALQDGIRKLNSQAVDSLHAEVMALSTIVNDLSVIAKTESGIIEMQYTPVNPVQVLQTTLQRFKTRFDDRQINIRADFQNADKVHTLGDADKLTQVFANIFENTVRYADSPGTVMVVGEVTNDHINIFIEDTGPGVAEASLNRLFDRLYRTDLARTRESGGSGLGLSICKSIIEAHQGRIWAENVDSGGLRIVIELPISK